MVSIFQKFIGFSLLINLTSPGPSSELTVTVTSYPFRIISRRFHWPYFTGWLEYISETPAPKSIVT